MSLVKSPVEIVAEADKAEFPGLLARHPSWERVPLGEFCTVQNGAPFSSKLFNAVGDGVPLIRIRDVGRDETDTYFSGEFDDAYLVDPGDLLVGMDGDFRVRRWLGPTGLLNQRVCRLVVNPEVMHQRLLEFLLQGYLDAIWHETSSITVKHLSSKSIQQIPLPVPPLEEQERIVEVLEEHLSRLDAALASIQTVRDKAAQFRRSLLHAAFSGALTGHDGSAWPVMALNDLVGVKSDIVDGPFGSNLKSAHYVHEGARVVRLQNIGFGSFVPGDAFITLEHYETLDKHNVVEGDLLFASLGENLPRTCLAPQFDEPAIVKADCIRVRLRPDVNPEYVLHATQRPEAKRWAADALHGMGRPRLGLGAIREFPVPLPDPATQDEVVKVLEEQLSRLDATLAAADRVEALCTALRRSLLHAAFTGKLTEEWRETAHV